VSKEVVGTVDLCPCRDLWINSGCADHIQSHLRLWHESVTMGERKGYIRGAEYGDIMIFLSANGPLDVPAMQVGRYKLQMQPLALKEFLEAGRGELVVQNGIC
jgi:hypothetical protein